MNLCGLSIKYNASCPVDIICHNKPADYFPEYSGSLTFAEQFINDVNDAFSINPCGKVELTHRLILTPATM